MRPRRVVSAGSAGAGLGGCGSFGAFAQSMRRLPGPCWLLSRAATTERRGWGLSQGPEVGDDMRVPLVGESGGAHLSLRQRERRRGPSAGLTIHVRMGRGQEGRGGGREGGRMGRIHLSGREGEIFLFLFFVKFIIRS